MMNTFTNAKTARFGSGSVIIRAKHNESLNEEAIAANAPSIFATAKHDSRSERYIHTSQQ